MTDRPFSSAMLFGLVRHKRSLHIVDEIGVSVMISNKVVEIQSKVLKTSHSSVYINVCLHSYVKVCRRVYVNVCMHVYENICMPVYVTVHLHECVIVCMHVYRMYVGMYM